MSLENEPPRFARLSSSLGRGAPVRLLLRATTACPSPVTGLWQHGACAPSATRTRAEGHHYQQAEPERPGRGGPRPALQLQRAGGRCGGRLSRQRGRPPRGGRAAAEMARRPSSAPQSRSRAARAPARARTGRRRTCACGSPSTPAWCAGRAALPARSHAGPRRLVSNVQAPEAHFYTAALQQGSCPRLCAAGGQRAAARRQSFCLLLFALKGRPGFHGRQLRGHCQPGASQLRSGACWLRA